MNELLYILPVIFCSRLNATRAKSRATENPALLTSSNTKMQVLTERQTYVQITYLAGEFGEKPSLARITD